MCLNVAHGNSVWRPHESTHLLDAPCQNGAMASACVGSTRVACVDLRIAFYPERNHLFVAVQLDIIELARYLCQYHSLSGHLNIVSQFNYTLIQFVRTLSPDPTRSWFVLLPIYIHSFIVALAMFHAHRHPLQAQCVGTALSAN